jgi:hypothetical protein
MTFAEFRRQSRRSMKELARTQPRAAFLFDLGRHAAVMAVVIVVMDVTPLSLHADAPWVRLGFIGFWSVFMALVTRKQARAQDEPDSSSPSVI